jgi:hypothetical protein
MIAVASFMKGFTNIDCDERRVVWFLVTCRSARRGERLHGWVDSMAFDTNWLQQKNQRGSRNPQLGNASGIR